MLINYIPDFLRDISNLQYIFSSLDIQVDKIYDFQQEILSGQFIYYCNEKFIQIFEEMLSITPNKDETISERRNRLILKFNEKLPYTMFRLNESLDIICGKGNHSVFVVYNDYSITLRILSENSGVIMAVSDLAERMIPANMKVTILSFNTHQIVGKFRHRYIRKYTHRDIYKSIL